MLNRISVFVLSTLALAVPITTARAAPIAGVGFERERMADGTEVGVWYPTGGAQVEHQRLGIYQQDVAPNAPVVGSSHPLVVMSHGTGGDFAGHYDTAIALARAGFIAAALTHPGDNWRDQSRATQVWERPRALSALITYMLDGWHSRAAIDPARVGAFGFSAGGFTVLAAAGGKPDLSLIVDHCRAHPEFFDCVLVEGHSLANVPTWSGEKDQRIKAVVVAGPALGFTFNRAGLSSVDMPVQLWRAGSDQILPAPFYADAVRSSLPRAPEFHDVPGAGHFDFLAPCAPGGPAPLCSSAAGFDRAAFHASFDAEVVRFFRQHL